MVVVDGRSSRHLHLLLRNSDSDDDEADHSFTGISFMATPASSVALDVVGNPTVSVHDPITSHHPTCTTTHGRRLV